MEITLKQLKSLLRTLEEGGVSEFEYQDDKYRMRLAVGRGATHVQVPVAHMGAGAPAAQSASSAAPEAEDEQGVVFITSPFVGTFYRAPSPGADPFTKVGAQREAGPDALHRRSDEADERNRS